ncbi:MAG: hypothetical protein H7259_10315, partial [Cytophagales bacterium]|nr:hypothetical protein [Cytophaga sp.]
ILFFIFSGFIADTNSNTSFYYLKYDVEIQGKVAGWMTSTKTVSSDKSEIKFLIDSKVEVDFLTKIDVRYNLESIFKNNFLNISRLVNIVNKDTQTYTRLQWDGIRYQTWNKDKSEYINAQKIVYSIGCLYFKEPVGLTTLFSEKYLAFCPITKNGEYYTVSFPDGNKSIYKYQNGICVWVEAKQKLYKIIFRLKEIK